MWFSQHLDGENEVIDVCSLPSWLLQLNRLPFPSEFEFPVFAPA